MHYNVSNKATKFAHQRNGSNGETSEQRRKIARICALFKAYMGEWTWEAIGNRWQRPCYLRREIMRTNKQTNMRARTRIRKYSLYIGLYSSVNNSLR
jgi:hypothetical protein